MLDLRNDGSDTENVEGDSGKGGVVGGVCLKGGGINGGSS